MSLLSLIKKESITISRNSLVTKSRWCIYPSLVGLVEIPPLFNLVHATAIALIQVIFEVPNMNIYIEWFLPANAKNLKTVMMISFYSKQTLSTCTVTN